MHFNVPYPCPQREESLWRMKEVERRRLLKDSSFIVFPLRPEALLIRTVSGLLFVAERWWDGWRYIWKCGQYIKSAREHLSFPCILRGYIDPVDPSIFRFFDVLNINGLDMRSFPFTHREGELKKLAKDMSEGVRNWLKPAVSRTLNDSHGDFYELLSHPVFASEHDSHFGRGIRLVSFGEKFDYYGTNHNLVCDRGEHIKVFVLHAHQDNKSAFVGIFSDVSGRVHTMGSVWQEGLRRDQVVEVIGYDYRPKYRAYYRLDYVIAQPRASKQDCVLQQYPYLAEYFKWESTPNPMSS